MQPERRALYNALRMNWLLESTEPVEAWQVDDYRTLSTQELFQRLKAYKITFTPNEFVKIAQDTENPEDLTSELIRLSAVSPSHYDPIYLNVFELWRRLLPERPCLSIFCDELDHLIYLYDQGALESPEMLQDALANLEVILKENTDYGADPIEIFDFVSAFCANDLESFIHDFTAEQIDLENYHYAQELIDGFSEYMEDIKWFDFLQIRLLIQTDPKAAFKLLKQIKEYAKQDPDYSFNLEILCLLAREGSEEEFKEFFKQILPLVETEEDFQDILVCCADFFNFHDLSSQEKVVSDIIERRKVKNLETPFNQHDSDLHKLKEAVF